MSFFFILMFKDLLLSVKPTECTYVPLQAQKLNLCLQNVDRIQLHGSYDRCALIEMGRLMITNCLCLITVIMLDRKEKKGWKQGKERKRRLKRIERGKGKNRQEKKGNGK